MSKDLSVVLSAAAEARDVDLRIAELEQQLDDAKKHRRNLYEKIIPDLFDAAGIDRIGLSTAGNLPAIDYVMRPYFRAGIAASWDNAKKEEGFSVLRRRGAGDLIKVELSARFPKGSEDTAKRLAAELQNTTTASVEVKASVHPQTLTAWLRELYEVRRLSMPLEELEKIGASVGRVVTAVDRKD